MNKKFIKSFAALLLVLCMMLTNFGGWNHVLAEETSEESPIEQNLDEANPSENENKETNEDKEKPQEDNHEEGKIEEDNKEEADKTVEENTDETENDGLEISDEVKPEAVGAAIPEPTVNPVLIGSTTISGDKVHKARVQVGNKKQTVIATVHVILKGQDGTVKATLEDTPKSGTKWSVNLPEGVKVEAGDTVIVYQQIGEDKSPEVTANAQPSKADTVTLTMPSGEIWIEQTSSNQVNEDEQAEAVQMLKDANPAIADDIKSVKFSIDGTEHAYYEVTYTDESTSGRVEAPNLKIKQVTEYSRGTTIDSITVVDNVVKGKLAGEGPFDGIKVQILLKLSDAVKDSYCDEGKCLVDKDTSNPVDATVNGTTGEFTYTIPNPDLKLDQAIGVTVKEPHKFKSCSKTTVKPVIVGKTEVKDPRKLTGDNKTAIEAAIRTAYTIGGKSKLPNGTGFKKDAPAVIQIDDSGNAKIFSGNDVVFDSSTGVYAPVKNEDGSYKLTDGASPKITIPAKDLVKNIKPEKPDLKMTGSNVIITPNEKDTDANSISVSYTGKDGSPKTTKATKGENGWTIEGDGAVDANGVITLPKDKVKGNTDVTATVTDKGGIADDDTTPLTSEQGSLKIEETKADKVEALGGLDPVAIKKWVGDKVDWKDGVKAKDSATEENKGKINELLKGAKFEDVTEENRNTSNEGDFEGKIKITFDDKSELVVEKQMLYVSNHVTSMDRKDKVPTDALDVEFKLGEGTKVDNTTSGAIEGNKDNPTSYSKYKVKPNTNLKDYKLPNLNASVIDSIKVTPQEGYTEPVWTSQNGKDFVASDTNKVFTATATKTYDITFDANTGGGTKDKVTQKVNTEYELPAANTFTAPDENHVFSGWQIGDDSTNLKQPGEKITITGDTVVKAIWKPIELKVNFLPGTGASGEMKDVPVNKGSDYKLPEPTFKAPDNQEFAGWKVGNEDGVKKAGETIKITDNVTLTATWKDIMVKVSYNANGGSETMTGAEIKKGSNYTLLPNAFKAPSDKKEFKTWEVDGKEVAPGTEITVEKDTEVKAIWKDIEYKVTFNGNTGKGSMDAATVKKGEKYKLPDNSFGAPSDKQEFKTWEIDGKEVAPGTEITVEKDTEVKAIWKDIEYKVTFNGNTGTGSMDAATVKKGEKYKLPNNTFGAPSDKQEFKTWEVDGKEVEPGTEITIEKDTVVKAIWKDIEYKVTFNGNTGTGSMTGVTVKKGEKYELPANGFTAPKNKEFDGWMVGTEKKAVGDKITINGDTEVKAIWKDIMIDITFDKGEGSGEMTKETVKKGSKFKLPASTFTPPAGMQFAGWKVGDENELKAVGTEITINDNIKLTAVYKNKPVEPGKPDRPDRPDRPYRPYRPYPQPQPKPEPKPEPKPDTKATEMERGTHHRYLYGYPDGTVRPEGLITRAEAAALIARLANLDMSDASKPNFKDVPSRWYNSAINAVVKKNLMFANKDGKFRPNEAITRGEFARALFYIDKVNDAVAPFADVKGHEFEKAINQAYGNDRISGYPDGTFRPNAFIKRAEAAKILNHYANRGVDHDGILGQKKYIAYFTDLNETYWGYYEIMEAANSHEYERPLNTRIETWTKIINK